MGPFVGEKNLDVTKMHGKTIKKGITKFSLHDLSIAFTQKCDQTSFKCSMFTTKKENYDRKVCVICNSVLSHVSLHRIAIQFVCSFIIHK